jgi:hypothetical protein
MLCRPALLGLLLTYGQCARQAYFTEFKFVKHFSGEFFVAQTNGGASGNRIGHAKRHSHLMLVQPCIAKHLKDRTLLAKKVVR